MRPWQQVLESVDYIVAMVIRRGLMSLEVGIQDTEFLLQTWGLFCHWLKEEGLQRSGGSVNSEALNKLEVIILLLQKLNTKLKVFTGNFNIESRLAATPDFSGPRCSHVLLLAPPQTCPNCRWTSRC